MGNYRYIHTAFKREIYALSTKKHADVVARTLEVSDQTVRELKQRVLNGGDYPMVMGLTAKRRAGQPRKSNATDLAVCDYIFQDPYLTIYLVPRRVH